MPLRAEDPGGQDEKKRVFTRSRWTTLQTMLPALDYELGQLTNRVRQRTSN